MALIILAPLALIGLFWAGAGVALIAIPGRWLAWSTRLVSEPSYRFVLTQVTILVGLLLIIGTPFGQFRWVWATIGSIAVLKGVFFLGAPERMRAGLMAWWLAWPAWGHRLSGLLLIGLATLLAVDLIRHVP